MRLRIPLVALLAAFALLGPGQAAAQIDADYEMTLLAEDASGGENLFSSAFKPIFGLGEGVLSFMGDVSNNYRSPMNGMWGTSMSISRAMRYIEISFNAVLGQISAEHRSTENLADNKNFRTDLFMGGLSVAYNFNHLLLRKRPFHPFVSLGVDFLQFTPKGDLYAANGDPYTYHPDGSIRDASGHIVTRDYTYETNLRETSRRDYSLVTLAIPVEIGFNITVTDRMTLRVADALRLTMTDWIDDTEGDAGLLGKDMINYAHVSLHLDLFSNASEIVAVDQFKKVKFVITDGIDSDGDGVDDFNDECPDTKSSVVVDYRGCPLDSDNDGVADYMDEEPNTPKDAVGVSPRGVRYTNHHLVSLLFDPKAIDRKLLGTYYDEERQTKERKKYDKMPDKFRKVDTNNDGWISPGEMRKAIDLVFDFKSSLTIDDVNELLEYFWVQ